MKLSADELRAATACTVDATGYVAILRTKGVIPNPPPAARPDQNP